MRPVWLEIEGFTSFRDKTAVDFDGADLFVLTGPTGAGKSSVIDAITFALYGTVPRLDDRRLVEPVISRGLSRARVSLDFTIGEKRYRAVRVVRTTTSGASTPEARLEDDAENTLAGSARELSEKVEEILGLSFEQFTRSVVLPQGDFAKLLHEKPSERQSMLRRLLGTELFGRLASRARERHTRANADVESAEADIAEKEEAGVTPEGLDKARGRAADLDNLQRRIQDLRPQLDDLRERERAANSERTKIESRITQLAECRTPDGVAELAQWISDSRREHEAANSAHSDAVAERQRREDERKALPDKVDLQLQINRHTDLAQARTAQERAAARLEEAQTVLNDAQAEANQAAAAATDAERALRDMEDKHRAYHLASTLTAGDSCPVCLQHIAEPPDLEEPDEIRGVHSAYELAQSESKTAAGRLADAQSEVDRRGASFQNATRAANESQDASRDDLPHEDLVASLDQVTDADTGLQRARDGEDRARERLADAAAGVKALDEEQGKAWLAYGERRDSVAEMQPPPAERNDLAAAWTQLVEWATEQNKQQHELLEQTEEQRASAQADLHDLEDAVAEWCDDAGVNVTADEEPLTACSREIGQQGADVERIKSGLSDLEQRRRDIAVRRKEAILAREMADHLRTDRFEGWLMAQVLEQLCVEASKELRKLSNDGYSLSLNERNDFVVVDHQNADERRPVKTLSGGETFLASLSLALSLSTHLVNFAVGGTAKLEALFLDEGFGTLDPGTLDMVTDALEELGSDGRMVGVVTHVPSLAEQIPVRFEVTKRGNQSSIERVEA